jgi:hypothetical protein
MMQLSELIVPPDGMPAILTIFFNLEEDVIASANEPGQFLRYSCGTGFVWPDAISKDWDTYGQFPSTSMVVDGKPASPGGGGGADADGSSSVNLNTPLVLEDE